VVLIGKFMTYPLLFYLPVGRLWARNEPDCSSQDKRINSSKGAGSRQRLSALGLRRDPHGSVKQIHHEELEDGDKERPSAFPKIMLKQTDSGIQQSHGAGERTQDQQRRRRLLVDRPPIRAKPEEFWAPPRTSPIATTPPLERIRQGPGTADG
jgi:predicted ATP-binding protein involved in virulence